MAETTVYVDELTNVGNIADGDKLVGERVDGTTVRITFNGVVYDADFTTNGIMCRTASATYANRTLTGTSNRLTITNGDGVSGNPTFDISSSYVGQATITTLGTVVTGTWQATTVETAYGGTGLTTYSANGVLYASNSSTLAQATSVNNAVLVTNGSGVPSFSTTLPTGIALGTPGSGTLTNATGLPLTTGVTGTLPVTSGGTNITSATAYAVLCGGTTSTSAFQSIADVGSSGQVLTSNGAGALPTFQAVPAGTAATQSDQETATSTSTYVSPGRQQFHPSAAKGWVKADTAAASVASYNVSSVVDDGTGLISVNWGTDFSSSFYNISICTENGNNLIQGVRSAGDAPTAGTAKIYAATSAGTLTDPNYFYMLGFGDQ